MESRLLTELRTGSKENVILSNEQLNQAIKRKNFSVGFDTEIERFLDNYITSSGISPGVAIAGLPNGYFEKMVDAVFELFPIFAQTPRENAIRYLAGYWVKYKATH